MKTNYTIRFVGGLVMKFAATGFEARYTDGTFWFYDEVQEPDRVAQKYTLVVPRDNILYISLGTE